MFNCLFDLAFITVKTFSNQNMHASSYYWKACLTEEGQTIYKLLFSSEMWEKAVKNRRWSEVDSSPAKAGCIKF